MSLQVAFCWAWILAWHDFERNLMYKPNIAPLHNSYMQHRKRFHIPVYDVRSRLIYVLVITMIKAVVMWIMVAGPYRSGSSNPEQWAANLRLLNDAAVTLLRLGHTPIIGVNMALPMIDVAGGTDTAYEEIMMPISLSLVDRCDACLRIGGPSTGADDEIKRFRTTGRPVYRTLDEVPAL
jgi:hypothetical protein